EVPALCRAHVPKRYGIKTVPPAFRCHEDGFAVRRESRPPAMPQACQPAEVLTRIDLPQVHAVDIDAVSRQQLAVGRKSQLVAVTQASAWLGGALVFARLRVPELHDRARPGGQYLAIGRHAHCTDAAADLFLECEGTYY